ncbi:MAG: tyrosine-type recombinase/integrase [Candidatus Fimimorpha sp.]
MLQKRFTTTIAGYRTVINFLQSENIPKKKIKDISTQEDKNWFVKLQSSGQKKYSALNQIKGVLKPAYRYAMDSDWVIKNPFDFKMDVLVNDSEKRDAISREQMRLFMKFIREHKIYKKHYDGFYLLFNTGMRCSEMCGLTLDDIDFEKKVIHIRRQLLRTYDKEAGADLTYINETKTNSGMRDIHTYAW